MTNAARSAWTVAVVFAVAVGACALRDRYYDRKVTDARAFCEGLVPILIEQKRRNGAYPSSIDPSWYAGTPVPTLIRPDFYRTYANGQEFFFHFRDPRRFDPRFWFNDLYGYNSEDRVWVQAD